MYLACFRRYLEINYQKCENKFELKLKFIAISISIKTENFSVNIGSIQIRYI